MASFSYFTFNQVITYIYICVCVGGGGGPTKIAWESSNRKLTNGSINLLDRWILPKISLNMLHEDDEYTDCHVELKVLFEVKLASKLGLEIPT
jgi:hypothetical protein